MATLWNRGAIKAELDFWKEGRKRTTVRSGAKVSERSCWTSPARTQDVLTGLIYYWTRDEKQMLGCSLRARAEPTCRLSDGKDSRSQGQAANVSGQGGQKDNG